MICFELIEGCPDCEKEREFLESIGHECGTALPGSSTMCEVRGESRRDSSEFHRLSHEPVRCESCKVVLNDHMGLRREKLRVCAAGLCDEWYCPDCGGLQGSSGPVECPSCGTSAYWVGRRRIQRMHRNYRARRR